MRPELTPAMMAGKLAVVFAITFTLAYLAGRIGMKLWIERQFRKAAGVG